ncbi:MAG: hypothetical protein IKC08_09035, partial [Lentisphaeria bacterium]|nr:hypothetical protein [Lentisphaeria bacterium]
LISHPDMGENYYQMIFNAKGNCYDHIVKGGRGDRSFDYNGKFAVKVLKDRWILEENFLPMRSGKNVLTVRSGRSIYYAEDFLQIPVKAESAAGVWGPDTLWQLSMR